MTRQSLISLCMIASLAAAGCGDPPAPEPAPGPLVRPAPFVAVEPAPAEPAAVEPAPAEPAAVEPAAVEPETAAVDTATAVDPAPAAPDADPVTQPQPDPESVADAMDDTADPTVGDPSAPLSEPPAATAAVADDATTADDAAAEDAPDTAAAPVPDHVVKADVTLEFPPPDEDGVIDVLFDQLASFEYRPAVTTKPAGVVRAPGAQPTDPLGKVIDEDAVLAAAAAAAESNTPKEIRALEGKRIRIEGYMIPLRFDDGKVRAFFLSRFLQGCCFGVVPRVNDVIEVEMKGEEEAYYDAYMPIAVVGKFSIREGDGDVEYLQSMYYMEGDTTRFTEDW